MEENASFKNFMEERETTYERHTVQESSNHMPWLQDREEEEEEKEQEDDELGSITNM